MAYISNGPQSHFRKTIDGGEIVKVFDDNGNTVLFTPQEAKNVVEKFIGELIDSQTNGIQDKITKKTTENILKLESSLEKLINEKILNITEKIMDKLISRKIDEEVNKRVDEKLKNIRDLLK